ncbi:MAG: 50S ribosomal protein L24 [bacterium]
MKLKKNDVVQVQAGKYKGKTGKILQVFPKANKVLVEGINIVKRHTKPRKQGDKGGIVEKTLPVDASKVMFFDAKVNEASRLGYKIVEGKKVRISKKSGEEV